MSCYLDGTKPLPTVLDMVREKEARIKAIDKRIAHLKAEIFGPHETVMIDGQHQRIESSKDITVGRRFFLYFGELQTLEVERLNAQAFIDRAVLQAIADSTTGI